MKSTDQLPLVFSAEEAVASLNLSLPGVGEGGASKHEAQDESDAGGLQLDCTVGADYFAEIGHRRLALEMLLDAAKTCVKQPDSREAAYEKRWLDGIEDDCPIPGTLAFEFLTGDGNRVEAVKQRFLSALDADGESLINTLEKARGRFESALMAIDGSPDSIPEHRLSVGRSRMRA